MHGLKNENELERAVLEYLAEHPQAADTVVGIADWWITQHQIKLTVSSIQRLLDRLTENGVLETTGEDERRCYRLKS